MAYNYSTLVVFFVFLMAIATSSSSSFSRDEDAQVSKVKEYPFNSIYCFGGSSSDSGNLLQEKFFTTGTGSFFAGVIPPSHHHHLQYRNSEGLLIVDYLASAFNLPSPKPYLMNKDGKFDYGANFAVDGATALDPSFVYDRIATKMPRLTTNSSLSVQVGWFLNHLTSICANPHECSKKLERAIFLVGEIGGGDYNYAFFQGKPIKEVATFVNKVVQSIKDAISRLIHAGAVNLMVPGILPIGCLPSYVRMFHNDNPMSYDHSKTCLNSLNTFSNLHNNHLRQALWELRSQHPHVQIVYVDYYSAFMALLRNHVLLGFRQSSLGKACWATDYNTDADDDFNMMKLKMFGGKKGITTATVCSDPSKYIHWDGIHLTQEANKAMVEGFIAGSFLHPKLNFPPTET